MLMIQAAAVVNLAGTLGEGHSHVPTHYACRTSASVRTYYV